MTDLAKKIWGLRDAKGLSRRVFGEMLGFPESKIQKIEVGAQRIDHEVLEALARTFQVDMNWLFSEDDQPHHSKQPSSDQEQTVLDQPIGHDFIPIPRYSVAASAGGGAEVAGENGTGYYAFNRKWLARRGLNPDKLSVISVRGDSMEPSFYNDDLILIDHAQTRPADGLIYAVRFSHDLYVKRVQSLPGDRLQLLSTNAFYPPIIIDPDASTDFQVIGRVVASMHEW